MTVKKKERTRNAPSGAFEEPMLSEQEALQEALRCLQCFDAPCTEKCAAHIPVPRFIRMMRSGNFEGAAEVVRAAHPFIRTCGEICPDDDLCRSVCTRGGIDEPIRIRQLHRFVTGRRGRREERKPEAARASGVRAAVVGGGPAGLSCARTLALEGASVELFERDRTLGGILASQIPSHRLPGKVLRRDVREAAETNVVVHRSSEVADPGGLLEKYDAVFVGAGAYGDASLGLPGEGLEGVMSSDAFLHALKTGKISRPGAVVVIGGGNVALDCAAAALHAGAERAGLYYRRSFNQMPCWKRELELALKAGVELVMLSIPSSFRGRRGKLEAVRFARARLGRPGRDGRRVPVRIPRSEFTVPCDIAVIAAGRGVEKGLAGRLERGGRKPGFSETSMRVRGNLYVGGDLAGRGTVVEAVGDGKTAARAIAGGKGGRS